MKSSRDRDHELEEFATRDRLSKLLFLFSFFFFLFFFPPRTSRIMQIQFGERISEDWAAHARACTSARGEVGGEEGGREVGRGVHQKFLKHLVRPAMQTRAPA